MRSAGWSRRKWRRARVPQAAYFREAVEDLLKKYEEPKKKAK